MLNDATHTLPKKNAVRVPDQTITWSYADLKTHSGAMAVGLHGLGYVSVPRAACVAKGGWCASGGGRWGGGGSRGGRGGRRRQVTVPFRFFVDGDERG